MDDRFLDIDAELRVRLRGDGGIAWSPPSLRLASVQAAVDAQIRRHERCLNDLRDAARRLAGGTAE